LKGLSGHADNLVERQRRLARSHSEPRFLFREFPDPHVPVLRRSAVVALQADQARRRFPEVCPARKLALRQSLVVVRAAELVRHHHLTVEPVLDVRALHDYARRVPFTRWLDHTARGRIQRVRGACRRDHVALDDHQRSSRDPRNWRN